MDVLLKYSSVGPVCSFIGKWRVKADWLARPIGSVKKPEILGETNCCAPCTPISWIFWRRQTVALTWRNWAKSDHFRVEIDSNFGCRKWPCLLGPALFQYANEASAIKLENVLRWNQVPLFCWGEAELLECAISNWRTCSRDRFISALLTLAEIINYRVDTLPRLQAATKKRYLIGCFREPISVIGSLYVKNAACTDLIGQIHSNLIEFSLKWCASMIHRMQICCFYINRIIRWPPLSALSRCNEFDHWDYPRLFSNSNFSYITVLCVRLSMNRVEPPVEL